MTFHSNLLHKSLMGKYINPVEVSPVYMGHGGLGRDCTCLTATCAECLVAILGVKDEDGIPVYKKTKCGFDCAVVYTQNIPKRMFDVLVDSPVLLTSEKQIKNLPTSARAAARRKRYRFRHPKS